MNHRPEGVSPDAHAATFDVIAVAKRIEAGRLRRKRVELALGAGILLVGLSRGGVSGPLLALAGASMLVRSTTDRPLGEAVGSLVRKLCGSGPEEVRRRDAVDQASWESFPASDPPAHSSRG